MSRFEEALTIIRTLLRVGSIDYRGSYYSVEDCVLDPRPVRPGGPPLMLGSTGARMMRIGLPHVDAWNVWWSDYGNSADGFAGLRSRVEEAAAAAGRAPARWRPSAVFVQLPGGGGRLMGDTYNAAVQPVEGRPEAIAAHVQAMAGRCHAPAARTRPHHRGLDRGRR